MKTPRSNRKQKPGITDFLALMDDWPESWAGMRADVSIGQGLVEEMRPFIIHLHTQGLTRKTVRRHLDNLWSIGGEIIRAVNDDDDGLRRKKPRVLLLNSVELGEAPLLYHFDESHQRSCDATARKLLRFLSSQP
jgi:hypothetical protein